jgi:hypothetical protein
MSKALRSKNVNESFYNKTIVSVDCSSANTWKFDFSDGTSVSIWAEDAILTPCGYIPGIFLDCEMGQDSLSLLEDEEDQDDDELLQDE